jgi:DNA-binding response OmpR family regulator
MSRSKVTQKTVLVVIADPTVRELVTLSVQHAGMYAMPVGTVQEGMRLASEVLPDVLLLDLDGVKGDVEALIGEFQALGHRATATFLLTSRAEGACGEHGSICGPNECIQKPFSPVDLIERVIQSLRHRSIRTSARTRKFRHGVLEVDIDCLTATVMCDDGPRSVTLPHTGMKLLQYLVNNAHRANRREDILLDVWGDESGVGPRTVDQYIRRLRCSLDRIGAADLIRTVHGLGYRVDGRLPSTSKVPRHRGLAMEPAPP